MSRETFSRESSRSRDTEVGNGSSKEGTVTRWTLDRLRTPLKKRFSGEKGTRTSSIPNLNVLA